MFLLNLISREAITNETVRVGKKFPSSQKISDSVEDIIKNYLSSDKLFDMDETQNPYGFIGNMRKPFTVLTMLASKSVPGNVSGKDPTVTIRLGDTVNFVVLDHHLYDHPFYLKTAQGTGTENAISGIKNNGTTNGTISWTPTQAGTYYYQCSLHADMVGTITVY